MNEILALNQEWALLKNALSSCAIEGNTEADTMLETMRRIERSQPVGEAYIKRLQEYLPKLKVNWI